MTSARPGLAYLLAPLVAALIAPPAAAQVDAFARPVALKNREAAAAPAQDRDVAAALAAPSVSAEGAVLWEPTGRRVLYGKEASVPRRMASTTKVMTVLLALEAGTLDDTVTVSSTADRTDDVAGAASLGLRAGERVPVSSLLAGLVLRSGNDAAIAVAEHVAGSQEAFVARMNARAAELGMEQTRFLNPTGLTDDVGHHASPLDLAVLAETAMRHREFARWAAARTMDVPGIGTLRNRNELLFDYPGLTGVKTGFTALAGQCLIASATRGGRTLYAVVLDSDDSFGDVAALLDHGFTDYRQALPLAAGAQAASFRWAGAV
ncbi:MAG: D-alanyl-D-alanine carboxypeptidase, partial [Actinomycetota bacterium]|nr:D-alanyl-D-alanine carboxypeptidase [Actinomycetota bacterium]